MLTALVRVGEIGLWHEGSTSLPGYPTVTFSLLGTLLVPNLYCGYGYLLHTSLHHIYGPIDRTTSKSTLRTCSPAHDYSSPGYPQLYIWGDGEEMTHTS